MTLIERLDVLRGELYRRGKYGDAADLQVALMILRRVEAGMDTRYEAASLTLEAEAGQYEDFSESR